MENKNKARCYLGNKATKIKQTNRHSEKKKEQEEKKKKEQMK